LNTFDLKNSEKNSENSIAKKGVVRNSSYGQLNRQVDSDHDDVYKLGGRHSSDDDDDDDDSDDECHRVNISGDSKNDPKNNIQNNQVISRNNPNQVIKRRDDDISYEYIPDNYQYNAHNRGNYKPGSPHLGFIGHQSTLQVTPSHLSLHSQPIPSSVNYTPPVKPIQSQKIALTNHHTTSLSQSSSFHNNNMLHNQNQPYGGHIGQGLSQSQGQGSNASQSGQNDHQNINKYPVLQQYKSENGKVTQNNASLSLSQHQPANVGSGSGNANPNGVKTTQNGQIVRSGAQTPSNLPNTQNQPRNQNPFHSPQYQQSK
jgi:hypothetical protein